MKLRPILLLVAVVFAVGKAHGANDKIPPETLTDFYRSCMNTAKPDIGEHAKDYCVCAGKGVEKSFTVDEFTQLTSEILEARQANLPPPSESPQVQKLNGIMSRCFEEATAP